MKLSLVVLCGLVALVTLPDAAAIVTLLEAPPPRLLADQPLFLLDHLLPLLETPPLSLPVVKFFKIKNVKLIT